MTNLEYLQTEMDIVKLGMLTRDISNEMVDDCTTEELFDLALHMIDKDRLFVGSIDDIAKRFLWVEHSDGVHSDLYMNPFVVGDMAYDGYYDRSYSSPEDEIVAHIVDFLKSDYDSTKET